MHSTVSEANRKPLLIWLGVTILIVMLMVAIGGLTRLTESGLSMVNWQPIHGTLPPLDEMEWKEEFDHYRTSPQYEKVNFGMSLDEFKNIFWLEYIHRLMGRITGVIFFLPFLFFLAKRMIPAPLALKLGGIFMLGGLQGVLGWYMVMSGLINEPMVSPLRLAAHLSVACLIFCLLLWQWLRLYATATLERYYRPALGLIALLFVQIILGAFVAGLDAGLVYNSFPTMNGQWVPQGMWLLEPWWHNLFQNPTTAQFFHRLGALVLLAYLAALVMKLRRESLTPLAHKATHGLIMILIVQIALGALTVIHAVPILLATLHQFTALLLLGCATALLYARSTATSLR